MKPNDDLKLTSALADCVQVTDDEGRLWFCPAATVNHFLARGITSLPVTINFKVASEPNRPWMTLTDAARAHMADLPPFERDDEAEQRRAMNLARVRVSRACDRGEIVCRGPAGKRLIEPTSLDAWRLRMRDADLNHEVARRPRIMRPAAQNARGSHARKIAADS